MNIHHNINIQSDLPQDGTGPGVKSDVYDCLVFAGPAELESFTRINQYALNADILGKQMR